jgi:hypothetical protein
VESLTPVETSAEARLAASGKASRHSSTIESAENARMRTGLGMRTGESMLRCCSAVEGGAAAVKSGTHMSSTLYSEYPLLCKDILLRVITLLPFPASPRSLVRYAAYPLSLGGYGGAEVVVLFLCICIVGFVGHCAFLLHYLESIRNATDGVRRAVCDVTESNGVIQRIS